MKKTLLCGLLLSTSLCMTTQAAESNRPFSRGALTQYQLDAWDNYLAEESSLYGCNYGDDPRLVEDPEGTLQALYDGTINAPVQVTYRTLLNMGPSTRDIISNNITVASMECNSVYYDGSSLSGTPVIPFEEAMTIMHDDYAMYQDEERLLALRDTFLVAGIDPRWFWAYFVADRAHMDMIGLDFETLVTVDKVVNKRDAAANYEDDSYNLPYRIFKGLHHRPIAFYGFTGKCESSITEPSKELVVWPEITDDIIQTLYRYNNIEFDGKWKNKVAKDEGGFTLYQETSVTENHYPSFGVTRGMTIFSPTCDADNAIPVTKSMRPNTRIMALPQ